MKIIAVANGNVLDVSDEQAERLIATGIYERMDEPKKSTKVDMPTKKKAK